MKHLGDDDMTYKYHNVRFPHLPRPGRMELNTKKFDHCSRPPNQESKPGSSKYDTRVVTSQPQRLITRKWRWIFRTGELKRTQKFITTDKSYFQQIQILTSSGGR